MNLQEVYKGTVKVIEENEKTGILKVVFPFCLADKKNTNGRTYPLSILEREVKKINQKIADKDSVFGFVGHPSNPLGNLEDVSHLIEKMSVVKGIGFGEAKILADSVRGKHLKIILKAGGSLNASMRGQGTVQNGIVAEDYKLLSVDFVTAGSFGKDVRFDRYCQLDCVKLANSRFCNTSKLLALFPIGKFLQCISIFKQIKARSV